MNFQYFPETEMCVCIQTFFHIVRISMTLKTVANNNLEFNGLPFLNNPDTDSRSLLIFRCVLNEKLKKNRMSICHDVKSSQNLPKRSKFCLHSNNNEHYVQTFVQFCPQLQSNSKCLWRRKLLRINVVNKHCT